MSYAKCRVTCTMDLSTDEGITMTDYTDHQHDNEAKADYQAELVEARREAMLDAQADAEHDVLLMANDEPERLMALFHDNATEADLDAMGAVLIKHIKSLNDGEECAFFDALLRIVDKELDQ